MNENDILDVEQSVSDDNIVSESDADVSSEVVEDSNRLEKSETVEAEDSPTGWTNDEDETEHGESSTVEVVYPEYTSDSPLPVTIVEEPIAEEEFEVFALSGSYAGTISDTYLDYFEGIVQKLKPSQHYVIWRSGQYAYSMCYGEDVTLNGSTFGGSGTVVEIYRNSSSYNTDWYVRESSDSLSLSASNLFCYSDLGMYPTVERGLSHAESSALLIAVGVITVFVLASRIFDFIIEHIYRK